MLGVSYDITDKVMCNPSTGHPSMQSFVTGTEECLRFSNAVVYGEEGI